MYKQHIPTQPPQTGMIVAIELRGTKLYASTYHTSDNSFPSNGWGVSLNVESFTEERETLQALLDRIPHDHPDLPGEISKAIESTWKPIYKTWEDEDFDDDSDYCDSQWKEELERVKREIRACCNPDNCFNNQKEQ